MLKVWGTLVKWKLLGPVHLHGQLEFHLLGESSLTLQLVVVQVEV